MGIETISAYIIMFIVAIIIISFMIKNAKSFSVIAINSTLGGTLFAILKILGMDLEISILNICLIGLLGIPGVFITLIIKFMF